MAQVQKCYSPSDRILTFADVPDDHDFLCMDYSSNRAQMSCGHTVTPPSLTQWCHRQLNRGKGHLQCGVCGAKWTLDEVAKMALLTDEEKDAFEKKLSANFLLHDLKVKFCPGCKSCVSRQDPEKLCVRCPQCTKRQKAVHEFCWQCLKKWKGPYNHSDHCGNEGCENPALVTLLNCKEIEFTDVKGVKGCPLFRACPNCGSLIEHKSSKCKNVTCAECKLEFCFVCLKKTTECLKTSRYYIPCSSGVAPRQTSIPVRR
ncbi:E3 ubiquitin-protein ligase RNF19A-like [Boleophthalmus pectinirostris]|uniref:E3 ubiquitin-protein ligase RNF19A-like n=1 Tax=Boleophthalmus pectinirostris TaxID=150288 RepID=UPI0024318661|nr:E3 ubiquitin-protein ligase RNF19A-like [Boleophthalmus pectinirostris]